MCDCHPRSKEDDAIWKKVKAEPPTKEEWAALHDLVERYQRLRISNHKAREKARTVGAVDPVDASSREMTTRVKEKD